MSDSQANNTPLVSAFFHDSTNTLSYVVRDATGQAAVIDPALDFDAKSGRTQSWHADRIIDCLRENDLNCQWILETHVHADHLTAAPYIQQRAGGQVVIGEHIVAVQQSFGDLFNCGEEFSMDGSQFDRLVTDGDELVLGKLTIRVLHTPGHTPACVTYVIGDAVFVGDTLFMPDGGTARADFPGGDAATLYRSIRRILELPGEYRVFVCHDYGPGGRDIHWQTTIQEQRQENIHLKGDVGEDEYVTMREERDATLSVPALLLPSIQVNIRAGQFPPAESNGTSYLKLPLNAF